MATTLILDTNVLVAGLRSSRGASHVLLKAVGGEQFTVGLTAGLVLEYEDVLKRPGLVPVSVEDVDVLVDYLCSIGKRCPVRFHVRPAALDPDDDLVLEAAIATGSSWIITHNTRDMIEGAKRHGIELLTPAEALDRLKEAE